jgi:ABC-2 type transport system permease protein
VKKLWVMVRKELREGIATRSFVVGTLLTPIFVLGLILLPQYFARRGADTTYRIALLEIGTRSLESLIERAAADTLPDGRPVWQVEYQSAAPPDTAAVIEAWTTRARDKKLDAFLVADSSVWDSGIVSFYATNVSRAMMNRELRTRLTDYVTAGRLRVHGVDPSEAKLLTRRVELTIHKIGRAGRSKSELLSDYIGALLFVMVLFSMIFGYGTQLMRALFEEKSARIIEVLLSSVSPFEIMMSKIIGQGLVALAQIAVWVALGGLLAVGGLAAVGRFGGAIAILSSPLFVLWFVVFLSLGYLLFSCWFAIVGAIVSNDQEAQPLIGPTVLALLLPLLLGFAFIGQPETLWLRVLSLVPPFSPPAMVMRLSFGIVSPWETGAAALLLAAAIVAAGWIAARVFRIGILMTGKRATLPEVLRWIRYR